MDGLLLGMHGMKESLSTLKQGFIKEGEGGGAVDALLLGVRDVVDLRRERTVAQNLEPDP